MVLSRRERIILIVAAVVVGAFVADRLAFTPVIKRLDELESDKQQLLAELNEARSLFERRRLMERKWKTMLSGGLRSDAEAESRVGRALNEWSQEARLTLTSVKPERMSSDHGLREVVFATVGKGRLEAVTRFLYLIETAELPVKIKYVQLNSASESENDMTVELGLSALYLGAEQGPSDKQSAPEQREVNDEEQIL